MSAQKRPCDPSSSAGAPPEKRRDKEGGDGGEGLSTGASNAVETVIKLGGVSNSVRYVVSVCVTSVKILIHGVNIVNSSKWCGDISPLMKQLR